MSADDLLADLAAKGIQLEPNGDKLRVHAAEQPDEMTYDLIRRHKADLLALLQPERTPGDPWLAKDCPEHWRHIPVLPPKGTVLTDSARYRVQLFNVWYIVHREPNISESHVSTVDTNSKRRMFADLHEFYRWAWAETHARGLTYRRMVN